MIDISVPSFTPCSFRIKFATEDWEIEQARALRRQVFCVEQGLFGDDDRDVIDENAVSIVAASMLGFVADKVVGTVRIHKDRDGVWWGSRLAVDGSFRKTGTLGASLIRLAVSSAHAMGCHCFCAHVQSQNVLLFRRLHWKVLEEVELHGKPHVKMQADLAWYPPIATPEVGFVALPRRAA
jgi:putative N-acetyltransferase (TIGR04045 family)